MLADCFPIEFNAGRRESARPDGSRIVFIPGKPNRWRAINTMGVRIGGDYSSESLAQAALNEQILTAPESRIAAVRVEKESHGQYEDPVQLATRDEDQGPGPETGQPRDREDGRDTAGAGGISAGAGDGALGQRQDHGRAAEDVPEAVRGGGVNDSEYEPCRTGCAVAADIDESMRSSMLGTDEDRAPSATGEWPLPDHLPGLPDPLPTPPEILDPDEPEFTEAEIREIDEVNAEWDCTVGDGLYEDDSADVSTVGAHDSAQGSDLSLTPIKAQQIIRREQRLRFTRDERDAELREAVRVLRALADVGEVLIDEVGR